MLPTLQALPGFQSYTAGFDRAEGHFLGVSVWATEAQAQAATEAVAKVRAEFPLPGQESQGQAGRYYELIAQA